MFLAQTDAIPHIDWTDVLWNKAPLVSFFGVCMFLFVWYFPQLVRGLLDFIVTTKESQTTLANAFEKLSETQREQTEIMQETHKLQERVIGMADSFRCKHQ